MSPAAALLLATAQAASAPGAWVHPFDLAQPDSFPEELVLFVEIPAEGRIKYEIDRASGLLFVDRFLQTPMRYPANYGSVPGTLEPDGDPLDALVFTRDPLAPGSLIRVRPIGLLRMTDAGYADDKVIAVPASAVDASFDAVRSLGDLSEMERQRLQMFFRSYKQIPEGAGVEVGSFEDGAAAREVLRAAQERYLESREGSR